MTDMSNTNGAKTGASSESLISIVTRAQGTIGESKSRATARPKHGQSKSEIVSRQMTITPDLAREWLDKHNTHNRSLRKPRVEAYAHEMRHGNWKITNEGIVFRSDGRLADGQHRLHAVVLADIPVEMMVFWNVDGPLNLGIGRTPGDRARFDGHNNSNAVAAVCGVLYRIETGYSGVMTASMQDLALKTYNEHAHAVLQLINNGFRRARSAWVTAAFAYAYPAAPAVVESFILSLCSLANLEANSPVLALDAVLSTKARTPRDRETQFYKTLSCLKNFAQNKPQTKVYGKDGALEWWAKRREKAGA
jgi:hypothetical protein